MNSTPLTLTRGLFMALLLAMCLVMQPSRSAHADLSDGLVIIVNARNPTQTLSAADIKKMFLGQVAFWHGVVPVKLVVRPDSSKAAKLFYENVLGMSPQAYRKHWDELQLAGRGVAPKALASPEELATAISQVPGAIGFGLASETWQTTNRGVKIIEVR